MAVERADEQPARCVVVIFPPFLLLDGEGFVGRLVAMLDVLQFSSPWRAGIITGLPLAMLAGFGLDAASTRLRTRWREALRAVLHHELTHHLESMAGDHSLEADDNVRLNWYRMRHKA